MIRAARLRASSRVRDTAPTLSFAGCRSASGRRGFAPHAPHVVRIGALPRRGNGLTTRELRDRQGGLKRRAVARRSSFPAKAARWFDRFDRRKHQSGPDELHDREQESHMAAEKITAETRTEFGKGAARRIRRADKVPAVVYGHGNDPIHITLPGHDTMMALKHGGANALLELEIDGTTQLGADQAGPDRPDHAASRAHRLRRRPQGREGHRRRPDPPRRRGRPGDPGRHRELHDLARGRGHAHPRVHRGQHRGRRGRHPDPGASDLDLPDRHVAAHR